MFFRVRVCAAVAAAGAVVLYSLRYFPHGGRCLPSLLQLLFTWYAVGGGVVAVPARSRPLALNPRQTKCTHNSIFFCATAPTDICFCAAAAAGAAAATAVVVYNLCAFPQQCFPLLLLFFCMLLFLLSSSLLCSRTREYDMVAPPNAAAAAATAPFLLL